MDKIVHFEIPADQVERAQKFYTQAFGWQISPMEGGIPYWGVNTTEVGPDYRPKEPGAINGGMMKRDEKLRSPVLVLNVSEIKAAVERVKNAGGKIVTDPYPVGNMGIVAYFQDTEGNILGMWQDLPRPG
jgi:uncharacterized protein